MELNEAIGLVTKYIQVRKNERVQINPMKIMQSQEQIDKMLFAAEIARKYFNKEMIVI